MRQEQIHKLQRNAGFMEEWLHKGVQDWKKNQSSKREREQRQLEFDYKQAQKYNKLANEKLDASSKEVHEGIEQFENTLRSNGVNPKVTKEVADRAMSESLKANGDVTMKRRVEQANRMTASIGNTEMATKTGAFTLTSTGLKSRSKKTVDDTMRKTRDKRRRQLIAEQEKYMVEADREIREDRVVSSMKHKSKQEAELDYEVWRTEQCKNVIFENRKLREAQYDKRRELDVQNANNKEEHMLKLMQEYLFVDLRKTWDVMTICRSMKSISTPRIELTSALPSLMQYLISQMKLTNTTVEFDSRNWHEWSQLFVQSLPVSKTLDNLTQSITEDQFLKKPDQDENNKEEGEQQDNEESKAKSTEEELQVILDCPANDKLDELELVDYL
eukprot:CAMPEP_0116875368 /NCGR_PEP_ID=MMETSP0463-20121206/7303_1 /TAXON_ID=181622 /ORGANISM="Strombidinopsis sp, Strain SopsisLIS2011" /LENGTH=386 /DNA_ID=CAMNT_0004520889 /DNA_START=432 /DNA_END=1596 /DNA_ORIENTATION=+